MQDGIWEEESNIVVLSWAGAGHDKTARAWGRDQGIYYFRGAAVIVHMQM